MELVALLDVGWSDVALESLRANHRLVVEHRDESCLVFSSPSALTPRDLLWAKNYFTVLARTERRSLARTVSRLAERVPEQLDLGEEARMGFRIVVHVDGVLQRVDPGVRARLEAAVHRASGADVSRRGGGAEVWVLARRDTPTAWLLRRVTKQTHRSRRGSLSAEMASLLCLVSGPTPNDVFLDPFAGTGSIPLARRSWPARAIYASDQEPIAWPAGPPRDVVAFTHDVRDLNEAIPQAISVVVTDPPWNEFAAVSDYDGFLSGTCHALAGLAAPSAGLRVVMLINRENTASLHHGLHGAGFRHVTDQSVLVNGHPASVVAGRL